MSHPHKSLCLAISLALSGLSLPAFAETESADSDAEALESLTVTASADASAEGLMEAYAGGQVATGGRAGILGNLDYMDSPFSITSYTNELIQDRQAKSVGDVLQNDPGVRVARGFGNFQEAYIIRGFVLNSDDIAYNGLYSVLPRQYIATELFERVEVLRGASSFLTGASPSGGAIGGSINLLPKRAPNEDLNRLTVGTDHFEQGYVSADVARRFGEDKQFGVRVNTAYRDGGSAIDDEETQLGLFSVGLDWRGDRARLSADIGWQDNQMDETRTNVTLSGADISGIPSAPDSDSNWAQPWSYSDEEDVFGTLRGEFDFTESITGWAAYGFRRTRERNSYANLTVGNSQTGAGAYSRFDTNRKDDVDTAELGLNGSFDTGAVKHDWVLSAAFFDLDSRSAFGFVPAGTTNLYEPVDGPRPDFSAGTDLSSPPKNYSTEMESYAIGDTLSFWDERFALTLGIRHQRLKSIDYDNLSQKVGEYSEAENTPVVGAVFKLTPAVSLYANYIESLRAGETAPDSIGGTALANAGQSLDPYVAEQTEFGVKFDTGSFGAGLAYFTTEKPRAFFDSSTNQLSQSGEDKHEGIELTGFGMATENVKLLGGVTWLDTKQDKTGDPSLDGNQVIGVAEWQATIGAEWQVPFMDGLALDARTIYTSSMYVDSENELEVPSWTRVDAGARYTFDVQGKALTLRARVHNVFDRDYWASAGGYASPRGDTANGYLVLGAPRTVTLSASMDF